MSAEGGGEEEGDDSSKPPPLPPWVRPSPAELTFSTGLTVLNSLTRQKEPFVTRTGDRRVTWYMYVVGSRRSKKEEEEEEEGSEKEEKDRGSSSMGLFPLSPGAFSDSRC
jgi:hypothetical protein